MDARSEARAHARRQRNDFIAILVAQLIHGARRLAPGCLLGLFQQARLSLGRFELLRVHAQQANGFSRPSLVEQLASRGRDVRVDSRAARERASASKGKSRIQHRRHNGHQLRRGFRLRLLFHSHRDVADPLASDPEINPKAVTISGSVAAGLRLSTRDDAECGEDERRGCKPARSSEIYRSVSASGEGNST